jgi:hypothetical protein
MNHPVYIQTISFHTFPGLFEVAVFWLIVIL